MALLSSSSSSFRTVVARRSSALAGFPARRAFSVATARYAGKEDALHNEDRDAEIEAHKQDALSKQKEGKGHWKDELASNSESVIKAERGEVEASEETIKKLQDETAKMARK